MDVFGSLGVNGAQKIALQGLLKMIGGEQTIIGMLQGMIDKLFTSDPQETELMAKQLFANILPHYNVTVDIDDCITDNIKVAIYITKKDTAKLEKTAQGALELVTA